MMATPLLIDGRNYLDPERLREAGFVYEGIGRARRRARRAWDHPRCRHWCWSAGRGPGCDR